VVVLVVERGLPEHHAAGKGSRASESVVS
jgi:hypothetical protein